MGVDFPDWGGQYNSQEFYPVFDMGELVARLGSPVTYDRRGAVLWFTTFEYGLLGFSTATSGVGSTVKLTTDRVSIPPFAVELHSAAATGSDAELIRQFPLPNDDRVGLMTFINFANDPDEVELEILHTTGSLGYYGVFRILNVDKKIALYTSTGYQDVVTLDHYWTSASQFIPVKVVVNINTGQYERLLFLGQEYDLTAYDIFSTTLSATPGVQLTVRAKSVAGTNSHTIYVDSIIYTTAEPAN